MCGLITFGAEDLLGFIQSYFFEFGLKMITRTYFDSVVDVFLDYAEDKLPKIISNFLNWLNNEV